MSLKQLYEDVLDCEVWTESRASTLHEFKIVLLYFSFTLFSIGGQVN